MIELPDTIFKHWIHYYEEDKDNIKVYRPADFKFPPSRGRKGFEIKKNGDFIYYDIGPTDRSLKLIGNWHMNEPNKISIDFKDSSRENFILDILALEENRLSISVMPKAK